ncbi:MAG TPA: hypothetical protein VGV64_08075 [Thermoplasmata archaeon]|nr:hypothetical protein [Thermoplasmata archaeon]HEV2429778.1 hypothetical protein [Thermoplasmata archaeon]
MRLAGVPITLGSYPAKTTTNRQFAGRIPEFLDRIHLPSALSGLVDQRPDRIESFLEDDNRGAVSASPIAELDGLPFFLSIKGIGSTMDPFSQSPLDGRAAERLTDDPDVRRRLAEPTFPPGAGEADRLVTGERWLRGSPYGGQGLEHASIALGVSERASLTSLNGFLIAPVVKIAHFPPDLQERIRSLHWYRRFRGPIVQELRLVPSNVRIYFHARNTLGTDVRHVFERFGLSSDGAALGFETAFVRSGIALLTLFARTLRRHPTTGHYLGFDFLDVWLDKDAVLAPNGSAYFVDLEGIEEVEVEASRVAEKIEDQVYRGLYEFLFAYEQIEQERARRFGGERPRKAHLTEVVEEALRDEPFVRVARRPQGVELQIRNPLLDSSLYTAFPLVDP